MNLTKDNPMELPNQKKENTKKTAVLLGSHLVNDTYPNLYPVLLPDLLMTQLHFGIAAAGLISTVSALTTQLLQPILGFWADRIGGKRFIVGGLVLGSLIVPITLGWAPSYLLLLIGLLIGGLGNAAFHPHAASLMSEMTGSRKGLGMSFFMVVGNLGRASASILASTALLIGGRPGIAILAIPGLIMAFLLSLTMSTPPTVKKREEKIFTPEFFNGLKRAGNLLAVVGLRFSTTLSAITLIPIMMEAAGYPRTIYAALVSVLFLAGMFGNIIGGALSDILGHKPVIIGSAVLASFWLVLFINSSNIIVSFVIIALFGLSVYASGPVTMVFGHVLFPKNKGMASGITAGLGGMLGSIGVAITGYIAEISKPAIGLYAAALAILISIPFVIRLKAEI